MDGDLPQGESPEDDSIATLFSRLIDDGEHFVLAELRLYRARVYSRLGAARNGIILALTGLLIAQSTIVAMLVGLVLILRRPLGVIGATALVTGGALALAILLIMLAIAQIRRATAIEKDD